jgi:tRNA pseudouridine55 synthase
MATGLLVVGVGRATRLLTHLVGADKTYAATIRLGQATLTDDAEGEVTASAGAVPGLDLEPALAVCGVPSSRSPPR